MTVTLVRRAAMVRYCVCLLGGGIAGAVLFAIGPCGSCRGVERRAELFPKLASTGASSSVARSSLPQKSEADDPENDGPAPAPLVLWQPDDDDEDDGTSVLRYGTITGLPAGSCVMVHAGRSDNLPPRHVTTWTLASLHVRLQI